MKKVNISEIQCKALLEYHHAYDNGLEKDAENIAYIAKDMYENGISSKEYNLQAFNKKIDIMLTNKTICACDNYLEFISIGKIYVKNAILLNDIQRLSSLIYHELGHYTNVFKSNEGEPYVMNLSQTKKDFNEPMFLSLNSDEYNDMMTILYRFHSRELKARCFETTMFLKQNKDPNITIQDVYNDRCSDITMMKGMINLLKQGEKEGPNTKYGKILKELGVKTWQKDARHQRYNRRNEKSSKYNIDRIRWSYNAKNTINYFTKRYLWLKKRIDKIFYDYITQKK